MKKKLAPFEWIPLLFLLLLAAYYWFCLKTAYYNRVWPYHDLANLSNYFTHFLPAGEFFTISHFTPTLALFVPFFFIFHSQLILVELNLIAFIAGCLVLIFILS